MADFIDREHLLTSFCAHCIESGTDGKQCKVNCADVEIIKNQPVADVRENVHGVWKKKTNPHLGHEYIWHCSNCGQDCMATIMGKPKWNFCPNCGADMREVQ